MDEGPWSVPLGGEGGRDGLSQAIVSQAQRDDAGRLARQPVGVAQYRQAQDALARRQEVINEAFDFVAGGLDDFSDDATVASSAEDENGKRRHVSKYREAVTRNQQLAIKRLVDVVGAAAGLALTAPALAVAAAAIRITMGRPVLFRQQRPGLGGKPFYIYKFRTMTDARGPDGQLKPDSERLTPVGRFIRSTSLDELPQLLNVLKGEMSLVGPRPLLMQYLGRYNARQARRHEMKPGITGLAQVRGRNALSWEEKFEYDVQYVENWSLGLDARILFETVKKVLRREGISQEGHATMSEFMGTKE